jgi:hypothetical protein
MNIQRQLSGKKPQWWFNKNIGKLIREAKASSIDWYWYGRVIFIKKLIPFIKKYVKEKPKTIVQEDNTSSYAHPTQAKLYNIFDI